jgi:formylglycine-generating enzyme required for sulfatase activity
MRQALLNSVIALAMAGAGLCRADSDDYLVVDLSAGVGKAYPLSTINEPPAGGWTSEYKTSKLVLRKLPRGAFLMGSPTNEAGRVWDGREDQRSVTLSNDFYIGVFEMTEGQCSRVKSGTGFSLDSRRPAIDAPSISYSEFIDDVVHWLGSGSATNFAIPTEAQWEYACRAESALAYCFGSETNQLPDYAWYKVGSRNEVGLKNPNNFGLYDMHGNVAEAVEKLAGGGRYVSGGSWLKEATSCRSASRATYDAGSGVDGFRVCLVVPLKLYSVTVSNGTAGAASGTNGQWVAISANPPAAGSNLIFDRWAGDTYAVADVLASNTTVRISASNVVVSATYRLAPYTLTVTGGSGSGKYDSGDVVPIEADAPAAGERFAHWAVVPADAPLGTGFDPLKPATALVMPPLHTMVSAVFEEIPTYRLTVSGGAGGGTYTNGQAVTIYASPPPEHHTFLWAGDTAALADPTRWITTLVMPASDVTVTATYPPLLYTLTVSGGTGGGAYTNGQTVTIVATNRPTAQHAFYAWLGDTNGVADVYAATTAVRVAGDAALTTAYRPLPVAPDAYMVLDLTAAQPSAAVSFLEAPPAEGWSDEYLTSRLVLRKVEGGVFQMGSAGETSRVDEPRHRVTLSQGFYLGLFEVTQDQWNRVAGSWPSRYTNQEDRATHPVERVSYASIRGAASGAKWPASSTVDSDSFIGRLRTKTADATFDLPTEAQWEYACRAGTTTAYAGDPLGDLAFYAANSGGHTWAVGQKLPNDWGFYDMHGNVAELCLDWYAGAYSTTNQIDPKGALSSPSGRRIARGGGCLTDADGCRSAARGNLLVTNASYNTGLRLARPVGKSYPLTVTGGFVNTGGWFVAGTRIPISATPVAGWSFSRWAVTPANAALGASFRGTNCDTLVTMPTQAVALAVAYAPTRPVTVTLDAAGGAVSPAALTLGVGGLYGGPAGAALPTPTRLGHTFQGWWSEPGAAGELVTGASMVAATNAHALYASWLALPNQMPVLSKCSPTNAAPALSEGAALSFSVTASDSTDPDAAQRGMSNVTWFVDGALALTTRTGAPGAIVSTLSYRPGTNVVNGAASRTVAVRAVALDRLGGASETNWAVNVVNAPAVQSITFRALPAVTLGVTNFSPGATATSKLPVLYASSNEAVAQIVDGLVQVVGAGTATITAFQLGDFDFKAAAPVKQTLTVKARLDAEVPSSGGAVSGAGAYMPGTRVTLVARPVSGFTFFRWEDGSQVATRTLTVPGSNVLVTAWFGATAGVPPPDVAAPGDQQATVGVFWRLALDIQSESLPAVTVSGLPAGLRYNAAAKCLEGVPTAAATNRLVTVRATNVNAAPTVKTFYLTVLPLPAWAQGKFNGTCQVWGSLGNDTVALSEMSVSPLGAISGKLSAEGTNYTFAAGSFTNSGALRVETSAAAGKVKIPLVVTVTRPDVYEGGPAALGSANFWLDGAPESDDPYVLWRNVWKDADMVAAATNYAGYYTCTLSGSGGFGSAYLLLTVDRSGGVKVAGKLADGTALSLSGTLIVDASGLVYTICYAAPSAYKGGCFYALPEFVLRRPDATLLRDLGGNQWQNRNPLATSADQPVGSVRDLNLAGGWYDTLGNLYRYYAGRSLEVDTEGAPTPTLAVGTNRVASVWWNPDGIAISAATNRYGVMTGLAAPAPVLPAKIGGVYDYAGTNNAVGLTISLIRATGVFKGSFKAWFDYGTTHTYKVVTYEGALTPERENPGDGVEGRGFFIWPEASSYINAQGRPTTYTYYESYDFLLLGQ